MNTLHITNGEYFNALLKTKYGQDGVPFNEAMMTGNTVAKIFSEQFVSFRAKAHGVSEKQYLEKLKPFLIATENLRRYDEICLWFGTDTFCQTNMLCVTAYLETQGYRGRVYAVYIDDETGEITKSKTLISLDGKQALYEKILVEKTFAVCEDQILQNAAELYFDYLSEDGFLARTIKENQDLSRIGLIKKLLSVSREYGLSDLQAEELIRKYGK